jgi:hypothetical protein
MGVTVQVRDLDPIVNDRLKAAAAKKGLSYSEFLRRELTRMAERFRIEDRWHDITERPWTPFSGTPSVLDNTSTGGAAPIDFPVEEIVRIIREERDRP